MAPDVESQSTLSRLAWGPLGSAAVGLAGWLVAWLVWPASWRFQLFCVVAGASVWTFLWLRDRLLGSPEAALWFFLVPMGVCLVAFTPPIASVSWDGQTHFSSALVLSQGANATYTGADRLMNYRDAIYEVGLIPYGTSDDDWHPNWRLSLSEEGLARQVEVLEEAEASGESVTLEGLTRLGDDEEIVNMGGMGLVARLPMAAGLALGRAVGAPLLWTYALGRVANYALWCVLCWLAMRRLVSGKWLFLAICLLPTQLFIAANWSYDPWTVGFASIATTSLIGALQRPGETIGLAGALWMIVPFYLATSVKAILFPWGLAFLCLPAGKFTGRRTAWLWRIAWLGMIAFMVWGFLAPFVASSGASNVDTQSTTNVHPAEQLSLMLREPWRYALGLANTTASYLNPVRIFIELPVNLCYLPWPVLAPLIAAAELALLAWATMADRSPADAWARTPGGRRLRVLAIVGFVVACGALLTALYVSYNEVGVTFINGMQVRYYLMFLPLILGLMLDGDAGRPLAWLARHLGKRCATVLGFAGEDAEGGSADAETALPPFDETRPFELEVNERGRRFLLDAEGVLLLAFVVSGFVVWFVAWGL